MKIRTRKNCNKTNINERNIREIANKQTNQKNMNENEKHLQNTTTTLAPTNSNSHHIETRSL